MRVQPAGRMRQAFREAVWLTVGLQIFGTAVWAGPEGATVVHGTATFQQSGSYTAIQASDKAIINYRSFDVARPETVQFMQPGASASVLNRIQSANPTTIDGTILANGRVFFVNPAGVIFGESAQVNVARLVASALDISNTDFLNGRYDFKGGNGSVVNKGQISAERAYLIGKQVANLGKINCPSGYVVMAAGDRVFLGEPGTDLLVEVDEPASPDPAAPVEGAAVRNEGSVEAAGGSIILAAAGDIYAHAISNVGRLSASAAHGDAGTVKLTAPEGTVVNTGSIEAASESGTGGQVQVLGERVGVFESGRIDASGAAGGGTALVGGDFQGRGEVPTSSRTSVGAEASIRADATQDGDGGRIIVWSDGLTQFSGHASAQGAGSGNGGLIEVSGKQGLSFTGTVALGAPGGHGGTLLLDPNAVTITSGGPNLSPQDDITFGGGPFPTTISELTLENTAAGSNGQIVLEATNEIVINDLTDNELKLSPGVSLVLRTRNSPAYDDNLYAGITMDWGDSIVASGGGSLTLQAGHDGTGFVPNSAAHIYAGALTTDGGAVTVQTAGEASLESVTTVGADNTAGGNVVLQAGLGTALGHMDVHGTIDTSGGPDTDGSGANPAGSVDVSGGNTYIRGNIVAVGGDDRGGDGPGGAGGSVTLGAPFEVSMEGHSIRTSGGSGSVAGPGGNVTFNGPLAFIDGLTVTAGSGDVVFSYPVDGFYGEGGPGSVNLVVNSAGTTRFEATVGGNYPLDSITTDAPGRTEIGADITTGGAGPVPDTQIYNDAVLLTNDVILTDLGTSGIFLNNTVDSAVAANYALTIITNAGEALFGGAVGSDALGALSNDAGLGAITVSGETSTTRIDGGEVRSTGSQTYYNPVTLNSPTVLTGSDLTFYNTIAAGASDLTLTGDAITLTSAVSGTGVLTLQPATPTADIYVGMSSDGGFDLDPTELAYLQNGFAMINIGRLDGQHNLYIDPVSFQDPVTFRSPVPGGGIYVWGKITGTDDASITLLGSGATTVLYNGIETAGRDILVEDSVLLADNADIILSTGAEGGNISITGPVNGTAGVEDMGDESLTLAAGTGTITVGDILGAAGAASGNGLTTVSVSSSGAATFGGMDITGVFTQTNAATGTTTFAGPVRVGSASLQGTSFDFADSVTTAGNMSVTATGAVAFGGAVTLGGDLVTAAGGNVTFGATLDDDGSLLTSSDVVVNSAGVTRFSGAVGGVHPIDSLSTDAAGTAEIGANITTTGGSQVYQDPLVLTNNAILTDQGATGIQFLNTVNGDGAGPWDLTAVTTEARAEIRFAGAVGGVQPLDQITVTNAGPLYLLANMNLNGAFLQNGAGSALLAGDITTTSDAIGFGQDVTTSDAVTLNTGAGGGSVTFQNALVLDGDLTVTAGTGDVTFGGTIDRASLYASSNLVVDSAGTTRFQAPVGQQLPIFSITTDAAGTTEISADISTGTLPLTPGPGTQTYNDPVVLTNYVTLTDHGMDGIFFNNTVGGNGQDAWSLRVETTAAEPQVQVRFNGAVTLYGGLWVQNAGGDVMFQGTVDAEAEGLEPELRVDSPGTTRFNAAVGGIHPVGRLYTDAAGTTEINANITTGGTEWYLTQTYDDPVVLTNSATLTDTGFDGITFNNTVTGDGLGPWGLTVVTTDPAAEIQFNGEVNLDGGLAATAAGAIYANSLSSASHNIALRSTGGDLNLYWGSVVNADRDASGNGGGVSLIAESGTIQSDGTLVVTLIGYSDDEHGVDLPYSPGGKTAILIDSGQPLHIAGSDSLIARGQYGGSYHPFVAQTEEDAGWARSLEGGTVSYDSGLTDDRAAVGFSTEPYGGGVPFDVGIYLRSRSGNVMLDAPVTAPDGATVVVDALDTISFGSAFTTSSSFPDTSRLEVVSRSTTSLSTEADRSHFPYPISYSGSEVQENQGPTWFTGYASVLRGGGVAASYLATMEYWHTTPEPTPAPPLPPIVVPDEEYPPTPTPEPTPAPPLPPIVVPVVVPPIPIYPIERLTWIPQAEIIVGPIQPPHPECLDVKDEDIEVLRKCQVACDLFSTDVSLNIVAEDIVTLNQRLKAQVQQVLPRLDTLSQKWPRVRPSDIPAIEQALRQDQMLNRWLEDGVEFVKLLRTKLGRTTNDSVERFLLEYLASTTDEPVLDFVQAYLKSKLAALAETGKPVAWIER
jgi:filamentous hemagglutinin family protein